jgi:hypothetical protein
MEHIMVNIAIVGGGPNGMYFLNGLQALAADFPELGFAISIFDKFGDFGSGWAHSPKQPKTSMLNRIVGQLAYAPDKSNGWLRPDAKAAGITFTQWCQDKYEQTGDTRYKKTPDDFPTRELYGESLTEVFDDLVAELAERGISVKPIVAEVRGLEKLENGRYRIETDKADAQEAFDFVMLATGHQESSDHFKLARELKEVGEYYNYAYPLFDIPDWNHKRIGIIGMGLTAIDTMLYYTENKGGTFSRHEEKLRYTPSGSEPKKLFALSRSGYFTYSRPHNGKEVDLQKYEHAGYFFTRQLVDKLRAALGSPGHPDNSSQNHALQLDFDRHVFPMLMLELQLCYYRILFGTELLDVMLKASEPLVEAFGAGHNQFNMQKETAVEFLTSAVETIARESIFKVRQFLNGQTATYVSGVNTAKLASRFLETVYGDTFADEAGLVAFAKTLDSRASQWGHSAAPEDHLFNWGFIVDPIRHMDFPRRMTYREKLLKFMELDRLQSEQGNLDNPYKGACDDVFRDLRQTVVYSIDFGGVTPASYNRMLKDFYAIHNRAANGNCIELMEKIEALIEADVIDVTYAKSNIQIADGAAYLHSLSDPGHVTTLDTFVDAKLHNFSTRHAKNPLFARMLECGIASHWIHKDQHGIENRVAGFNLTSDFQFINAQGAKERIFCTGQPSEGIMFFQNGSIRPNVNHHVANDLLACLEAFRRELSVLSKPAARREHRETALDPR